MDNPQRASIRSATASAGEVDCDHRWPAEGTSVMLAAHTLAHMHTYAGHTARAGRVSRMGNSKPEEDVKCVLVFMGTRQGS